MYRRVWSNLPPDPKFEPDLSKLGYFINNKDEVRSIEEPRAYYKFFINKNDRWNERQRFAFHEALENIIHSRLEAIGLTKLRLPLSALATEPHVPILASSDLPARPRVVVVIGESIQNLGVLAYRLVDGPGGVDEGSLVGFAKLLLASSPSSSPPGLVLANTGQLWWWPEGRRALNNWGRDAVPMPSAALWGHKTLAHANRAPGNETAGEHVRYLFDVALPRLANPDARVDVVAVGDGCDAIEGYLGREKNWAAWGRRMSSLVLLGSCYDADNIESDGFRKFLRERSRGYTISAFPLDTVISSGPSVEDGAEPFLHPEVPDFVSTLGCPVFSSGETSVGELLLVKAKASVVDFISRVAQDENYINPTICVFRPASSPQPRSSGSGDGEDGEGGDAWGVRDGSEEEPWPVDKERV